MDRPGALTAPSGWRRHRPAGARRTARRPAGLRRAEPATLERLAHRHRVPLRRHAGFELPVDGIDPEFRGPAIPPLAARVHAEFARPGDPVDAALVGRAAASVVTSPQRWADRGPSDVTLQHFKQLWHVLVRYGTPRARLPAAVT